MWLSKVKGTIRVFFELLFSALLFGIQAFFSVGSGAFIMTVPLLPSAIFLLSNPKLIPNAWSEFLEMFFWRQFIPARIVIYVGIVILLVAAGQWIWYRFKHQGLFNKGLYGKVRHPQFLGIITISMGLTIMAATYGNFQLYIPGTNIQGGLLVAVGMWLTQALGYTAVALFEEHRLTKKYGQIYEEYKRKTPFLFPIKNKTKNKEITFTIIILAIICIALIIIPFIILALFH
jgi:protein-S-isoprenylcysteine O-methyltransferase Ste14